MSLALDPQTEQRIKQQAELRHFATPDDLINTALDSLAAEESSWSEEEKAELDARYERSMAAFDRGEGIPAEKVSEMLQQRRRVAHI